MRSLIRLITEFFGTTGEFSNAIVYIPFIAIIVLSLYIANYVGKHYVGRAKGLIVLGAILRAANLSIQMILSFVIIPNMTGDEFNDIGLYYTLNGLLGSAGGLMFLYGIYLLLKDLFDRKNDKLSGFDNNDDSSNRPNSFIERN